MPGLHDIGKAKLRSCGLPCEMGRVACMETTLQKFVSIGREAITPPAPPPRLEDQLREAIRERHYSICTEQAYVMW